jgi:hypothetical protein
MKRDDPEQQFIEAAQRHGDMSRGVAAVNREHDKVIAALTELRTRPDRGRAFLLTCLAHSDPSVVGWAASFALPKRRTVRAVRAAALGLVTFVAWATSYLVLDRRAVRALQRLARDNSEFVGLDAETTLEEWRAGRLERF